MLVQPQLGHRWNFFFLFFCSWWNFRSQMEFRQISSDIQNRNIVSTRNLLRTWFPIATWSVLPLPFTSHQTRKCEMRPICLAESWFYMMIVWGLFYPSMRGDSLWIESLSTRISPDSFYCLVIFLVASVIFSSWCVNWYGSPPSRKLRYFSKWPKLTPLVGGERKPSYFTMYFRSFEESYNTPQEHTPGNPPTQLWRISLYSLLGKVKGCVPKVCWNNLRVIICRRNHPYNSIFSRTRPHQRDIVGVSTPPPSLQGGTAFTSWSLWKY